MQPSLAPTQVRMSSSRPSRALRGSSGSAMSARVMPTTSISPAATAAEDRQEGDAARRGRATGDARHGAWGGSPGRELVAGGGGPRDEVAAHAPGDLGQHFQAEAHPVVGAAAVLVEPLVERGRP